MSKNKELLEPLESAKTLGYLVQRTFERGMPHADDIIDAVDLWVKESMQERGYSRNEVAQFEIAALDFKKAFLALKVIHNEGVKLERSKGVRDFIPEDWPGFSGGR